MQKKEQELEAARLQHTKEEEEERSAAKTHMNEHLKKYTQKFIVDLNDTENLIKKNPQISNLIINNIILDKFKETSIQI